MNIGHASPSHNEAKGFMHELLLPHLALARAHQIVGVDIFAVSESYGMHASATAEPFLIPVLTAVNHKRLDIFRSIQAVNQRVADVWMSVSMHLIENSVDALHELQSQNLRQPIEMLVTMQCSIFGDRRFAMSVIDNGTGIPHAHLAKIVSRFRVGHGEHLSTRDQAKYIGGTGIGLRIVAELAKLHKATLRITSTFDSKAYELVLVPTKNADEVSVILAETSPTQISGTCVELSGDLH